MTLSAKSGFEPEVQTIFGKFYVRRKPEDRLDQQSRCPGMQSEPILDFKPLADLDHPFIYRCLCVSRESAVPSLPTFFSTPPPELRIDVSPPRATEGQSQVTFPLPFIFRNRKVEQGIESVQKGMSFF